MSGNPMHRCNAASRCRAKSKRTGLPCRSPAVNGYRVCRMHGARGGAPEGKRNGNFRHGGRTKEAISASRYVAALARLIRDNESSNGRRGTFGGLTLKPGLAMRSCLLLLSPPGQIAIAPSSRKRRAARYRA